MAYTTINGQNGYNVKISKSILGSKSLNFKNIEAQRQIWYSYKKSM